jgi:hypothetical protein
MFIQADGRFLLTGSLVLQGRQGGFRTVGMQPAGVEEKQTDH